MRVQLRAPRGVPARPRGTAARCRRRACAPSATARAPGAAAAPCADWPDALTAVTTAHARGEAPAEAALRVVASSAPLSALLPAAAACRDAAFGAVVTFSPKVFIPLTRLCRDACGYCTFAAPPRAGAAPYLSLAEVLAVARAGAASGATEALFTLGDAPEAVYPEARAALEALGHASTLSYVAEAAAAVLNETGLLPHVNAGIVTREQAAALKQVSVSQGLMLESTAERLALPGGPHFGCPDKVPTVRLAAIDAAGLAGVPFTRCGAPCPRVRGALMRLRAELAHHNAPYAAAS
jgi:FO synthase